MNDKFITKISIIIINYKVKDKLFKCLDSISKNTKKISYEIIIVDNDDKDILSKDLRKKYHNSIYIKSSKNLGYAAGNNLGVKKARGEYLFFLNPDTVIIDNAIEEIYRFIKSKKSAGIVSPLLVDKNLTPFKTQSRKELTLLNAIYSFSFLRFIFTKKSIYNDEFFSKWNQKMPIEVDTVPGAALMISKKNFNKIDGFDEDFFLYFEENDLSKRIKNLGLKLFIYPRANIVHEVGQSTKNLKNTEEIFKKSRFLYFKKNNGLIKSLIVESFLRITKAHIFIIFLFLTALFLRLYNLSQSMVFIGDQGWFYLSARDLLVYGKIPLVGITSSHTWLHQGPLWTYILSLFFFIFNFNPLAGGYFTAVLGSLSVLAIYKIGSTEFSKKVGIIAALFYAVSPLIVAFDRMPFDPTPIPFFTLLYFFSICRWLKGRSIYFPLVLFLIGILYNLELATFTLFLPFFILCIYGIYKKRPWIVNIINKKIISLSLISLLTPMLPILIYDFSHGFKQTVVFFGWIIYKPLSFLFTQSENLNSSSFINVLNFFILNVQKLLFDYTFLSGTLILVFSVIFLIANLYKEREFKEKNSKFILFILLIASILGILINKTPSDAYLPIVFPLIIFSVSLLISFLLEKQSIKYFAIAFLLLVFFINFYKSFNNIIFSKDFYNKTEAVNKIIALTKGQSYNLVGKGSASRFSSFTMNYEYLLWWKGFPPSKSDEKIKIYVSELNNKIIIEKN